MQHLGIPAQPNTTPVTGAGYYNASNPWPSQDYNTTGGESAQIPYDMYADPNAAGDNSYPEPPDDEGVWPTTPTQYGH